MTLQQITELLALADMYKVSHTTVRPCARPRCTTSLTFVQGLSGCPPSSLWFGWLGTLLSCKTRMVLALTRPGLRGLH